MQWSKPVPWKWLVIATAFGFSFLWFFEAWVHIRPNPHVDRLVIAVCPPSIALIYMAADGIEGAKAFLIISAANALLYFIAAAAFLETIAALRKITSR